MNKFLWVAIVGSVIGGLILLSGVLAGAPQPLASPAALAQRECDCRNLEALQIELRNAVGLQQAFQGKIADLRKLGQSPASDEFRRFALATAKRFARPPGDTGPKAVEYTPYGDSVDTGILETEKKTKKTEKEINERRDQLCGLSSNAKQEIEDMKRGASCEGIVKAVEAHEGVHWASCRRLGYVSFRDMHGADRAQEEVEAYGAQIKVLRAEIAKVLERADVRIETEVNTRSQPPPNPVYTALNIENRAVVPMGRAAVSGEMLKLDGEGKQITDATVEGNCRFTAGLPSTLTARASIETDGLEAQIRYTVEGTHPSIGMYCIVDRKSGSGMSMPVNISSGNQPVMKLPLENGAEKVFDQATSEAARILAQGGAKLSGQAKIRLILCEKSK